VHKIRQAPTVIALVLSSLLLGVLTWCVQGVGSTMNSDAYWVDLIQAARSEHLSALMLALHALQGKLVAICVVLWAAALAWRKQWSLLLLLVHSGRSRSWPTSTCATRLGSPWSQRTC
jgi:hypothetical protein